MKIGDHTIGSGSPVYIVAELSANHNQDFDQAVKIVEAAAKAGADAVKLQTYTADTLTIASDREEFQVGEGMLWEGRNLYDLYQEASMPWEWQPKLKEKAQSLGLDLFSAPFDATAVAFLEDMNVPAYKIASCELIDIPLIECVAKTGKPLIMSTGMASEDEISEALQAARAAGASDIALLKCTSAYPALPEEMHLRTIPDMAEKFGCPVGLSDHTLGISAPAAAVTLGACIIEKHLKLSHDAGGLDGAFSLEPAEFSEMVSAVRAAEKDPGTVHVDEKVLGEVHYGTSGEDEKNMQFRRSLFVVQDIAEGEELTEDNIRSIRPGQGMAPKHLHDILGKKAAKTIARGTPLQPGLIS